MADERGAVPRRVLVPDARGIDRYLRATWHADDAVLVMSTWDGDVCTGAVRVAPDDLADLVAMLVRSLGAAVSTPSSRAVG